MKKLLLVFMLIFTTSGCSWLLTEQVPAGYIGIKQLPSGFVSEILQPGYHSVYGRDKLVLIPTKEAARREVMKILCADELNLSFDLKTRARVNVTGVKSVLNLLNRQGASIKWRGSVGILPFGALYDTYLRDPARSIARTVVSKYQTTQVAANREEIQRVVYAALKKSLSGTPLELRMAVASNIDYPAVITNAMEAAKKREIAIKEEKAKQAVELLRMENRLRLAEKAKKVVTLEAEAEAIKYEIIGKRLTKEFLTLKTIEANRELYNKIGPGDKVFFLPQGMESTPPILLTK